MWFVAASILAFPLCLDATSDPDLWWHLRLGQWIAEHHAVPHTELFSYTAAGAPQVDHEWLSELLFWAVHAAVGLLGLALLVALVTWSGLLALALTARQRGAGGFTTGLVLLFGSRAIQPVAGTRPQMLTFALLCWSLFLLDRHLRRGGRRIWLLVPLFLLWAQLHAGFAAALGILAVVLAVELATAWWRRAAEPIGRGRYLTAGAALGLCAAAALVNPYGGELYRYALLGSTPAAHQLIQEWQPPDFTSLADAPVGLLILATAAAMLLGRSRLRPVHVVLFLVGTAAALVAVRNIAIAVALLSPTLAELLPLRYRLPARPALLPAAAAAAALAGTALAIARVAADSDDAALARQWPSCLVADLQSGSHPLRLWLPYGEAGRAIDQAWPRITVYAYGNDATLGSSVVLDYVRIAAGSTSAPSALDLLKTSGTEAVITPPDQLASQLRGAGWAEVAAQRGEVLLTAPSAAPIRTPPCDAG